MVQSVAADGDGFVVVFDGYDTMEEVGKDAIQLRAEEEGGYRGEHCSLQITSCLCFLPPVAPSAQCAAFTCAFACAAHLDAVCCAWSFFILDNKLCSAQAVPALYPCADLCHPEAPGSAFFHVHRRSCTQAATGRRKRSCGGDAQMARD